MFHSLFEDQNADFNRQRPRANSSYIQNNFKFGGPNDIYFGKGNFAIDQYNQHKNEVNRKIENDTKFENTKNKVRLVVYQNGFILNNGNFRDRSIPENEEFMNEVEQGQIPQELIRKGIKDLGILLINRKNEIYQSPISQSLNPIYNYQNYFQNPYQYQFQSENMNPYFSNQYNQNTISYNEIIKTRPRTNIARVPQTPCETRKYRNNLPYNTNTERVENRLKNNFNRHTSSVPKEKKSDDNKFINFLDLKKNEPEDNKKNKFTAFSGSGTTIGYVNTEGLHVDNQIKNYVDYLMPICIISIRLFNGEIVKAQFNYSQSLRDVYLYVRRISGSNNFILLDGFPPRPLYDYGRTIGELGLQNTVLTQKIN